ncbi:MAG: transposase, partial [Thioalkalivibrio sp.]|nr:transposase [Thioalkalivibrio sp.]
EAEPAWLAAPAQEVSHREAERRQATQQRRQDRYDRIAELAGKGIGKMAIARKLNLDRGTVASYLQQGGPPTNERRHFTPTQLDPSLPYLKTRFLDDDCRNAALLTREIREQGYTGSVRTVMRRIRTWKRAASASTADPVASPPLQLSASCTLAWTLLKDQRDDPAVELLKDNDEHAATLAQLAPEGLQALRTRNLEAWTDWRHAVATLTCSDLKRFLRSLERDETAVNNAVLLPYSNGPTEGNVHRIKLIKRTMYGRASFELLRKKILHHEA